VAEHGERGARKKFSPKKQGQKQNARGDPRRSFLVRTTFHRPRFENQKEKRNLPPDPDFRISKKT